MVKLVATNTKKLYKMDKKTKELIDDLVLFFEARNTGNVTNKFLNRCKEIQTEQLNLPVVL